MNRKEFKQHLQTYLIDYLNEKGFVVNAQNNVVKKTKDFEFSIKTGINKYHVLIMDGMAPYPYFTNFKIEVPLTRIYCFDKDEKHTKIGC